MRILIAEDEDLLREVIARVMRRGGHDVTEASSAEEALLAFREHPFPFVLTDVVMGEMSGLDLLRAIRAQDDDAMVVVMTSYATIETATAAVRAGAFDLIIKPFEDLGVIQALVRRVEDRLNLLEENRRLSRNLDRTGDEVDGRDNAVAATLVRDTLTGLYRASYFRHLLETEIARSRRHRRTASLVLMEVSSGDNGAPFAGDQFLRAAASLLASRCRNTDAPARYGPAGFAVVLPETDGKGAAVFADSVRGLMAAAGSHAHAAPSITVSAGVVTFPADGEDTELLLNRAGLALERAKERAGGSVVAWSDLEPPSAPDAIPLSCKRDSRTS